MTWCEREHPKCFREPEREKGAIYNNSLRALNEYGNYNMQYSYIIPAEKAFFFLLIRGMFFNIIM